MKRLIDVQKFKIFSLVIAAIMFLFLVLYTGTSTGCSKNQKEDTVMKKESQIPVPPRAEKIKKELTIHNHTRVDNYYWLKQRDNPNVIAYLKAENDYLNSLLKHTEELREKLFKEIVSRIKQDDSSVPFKHNDYYYYTRFEEKDEYPIHCRKKENLEAKEEIMLDVNEMAKGHAYYQVSGVQVSPDNTIVAYGVDTVSRRKYTIHFKNLVTGERLSDEIPNTTGGTAWANDNKTVFYTCRDLQTLRAYKIFKHRLGTPVSEDKEIYHEADETFITYVYRSKSWKYIMIRCDHTLSSEYRYMDTDTPDGEFRIIQPRERDHEYHIEHFKDKFYIRTNLDAKNFRLMETPVDKPSKENWQEVIAHRNDVLLEDFELFKDFLVVEERKNGLIHIRVNKWQDKSEHYLDFGEATYAASFGKNPEFETDVLRYSYTSLTTPPSTFDYNMNAREKQLMKQKEVVGDFDSNNYQSERLYASAKDGTKIPISLVYRKGHKKNGDNPLFLTGYGSYGYSNDPYFHSDRLSLLDRGFAFAIAHIRGGQEMGRHWYEDGKLLRKKNTFTDFIACAQHLIAEKFTNPGKLFASGGSAGGLLMGAVVNMRPDLFKGIIIEVPFVDVITTMLDESIPLTTSEYDEWGDPRKKEYYDYMLSYSPYDNIEAKKYPAMLVTAGLHDSQVQYWEPAKWVAKLRTLKTDRNPLFLYTNIDAGHSGVSGRFRQYKEIALIYTFILDQLGIKE